MYNYRPIRYKIATALHNIESNWLKKSGLEDQKQLTLSVTRLGDLINFGQLFKAFGNN